MTIKTRYLVDYCVKDKENEYLVRELFVVKSINDIVYYLTDKGHTHYDFEKLRTDLERCVPIHLYLNKDTCLDEVQPYYMNLNTYSTLSDLQSSTYQHRLSIKDIDYVKHSPKN